MILNIINILLAGAVIYVTFITGELKTGFEPPSAGTSKVQK